MEVIFNIIALGVILLFGCLRINRKLPSTFKRDAEWTTEKGSRVIALSQFPVNLLRALHKELIMINAYMFCQKIKAFINFNF